jgi:hypothetical protein
MEAKRKFKSTFSEDIRSLNPEASRYAAGILMIAA